MQLATGGCRPLARKQTPDSSTSEFLQPPLSLSGVKEVSWPLCTSAVRGWHAELLCQTQLSSGAAATASPLSLGTGVQSPHLLATRSSVLQAQRNSHMEVSSKPRCNEGAEALHRTSVRL